MLGNLAKGPGYTQRMPTVEDVNEALANVIDPNQVIGKGYENTEIETKDGRSLTGFLADKDNQIVILRGLDGQDVALARTEITEMKASGLSLMPEALEMQLSKQDLADVIAYLMKVGGMR